jgi:hypothetical protein
MKLTIGIVLSVLIQISTSANMPPLPSNIMYYITIWVGNDAATQYNTTLCSPRNISFYEGLTQAAIEDPKFAFEADTHEDLGHFITKVGGFASDPKK